MATDVPDNEEKSLDDISDSDWDNRVLCSDGNCIGVIGPDGRCKECGKKYDGELPETSSSGDDDQTVEENEGPSAENEEPSPATDENPEEIDIPLDDEWENRILCSDGNCIGIIGPDGKCKECGKAGE